MTGIDHLHHETQILKVKPHNDLLTTQFAIQCLDPGHPCHHLTSRPPPPRQQKLDFFHRYGNDAHHYHNEASGRINLALTDAHTTIVRQSTSTYHNRVLDRTPPPPIHPSESELSRAQRSTLAQLRSGFCTKLKDYQHRINPNIPDTCPDCHASPHGVHHLFNCPEHPSPRFHPIHLWSDPPMAARELAYILDP